MPPAIPHGVVSGLLEGTLEIQEAAARELWRCATKNEDARKVAVQQGVLPTLSLMLDIKEIEAVEARVSAALCARALARSEEVALVMVNHGYIDQFIRIITVDNMGRDDLICPCVAGLSSISRVSSVREYLVAAEWIHIVVQLMREKSGTVRAAAAEALRSLARFDKNRAKIVQEGAIDVCSRILKNPLLGVSTTTHIMWVLWSLTMAPDYRRAVLHSAGIIEKAVSLLLSDSDECSSTCAAVLGNLSVGSSEVEKIVGAGAVPSLMQAVAVKKGQPRFHALKTLQAACSWSMMARRLICVWVYKRAELYFKGELSGFDILLRIATGAKMGNEEDKANAIAIIGHLAVLDESAAELRHLNATASVVQLFLRGSELVCTSAAGAMRNLSVQESFASVMCKPAVVKKTLSIMRSGADDMQLLACCILRNIAASVSLRPFLKECDVVAHVVKKLKRSSLEVQGVLAAALANLASDDEQVRVTAGQGGCIPSIVSVLHSGVGETRVDAARAISSLALSDDLEGVLSENDCVSPLLAMQHDRKMEVRCVALDALQNVCAFKKCRSMFMKSNGLSPLIQTLRAPISTCADLVMRAASVLANLATQEKYKGKIVKAGGLKLLAIILGNSEHTNVTAAAAGALRNLVAKSKSHKLLASRYGCIESLTRIVSQSSNVPVLVEATAALRNLVGKVDDSKIRAWRAGILKAISRMLWDRSLDRVLALSGYQDALEKLAASGHLEGQKHAVAALENLQALRINEAEGRAGLVGELFDFDTPGAGMDAVGMAQMAEDIGATQPGKGLGSPARTNATFRALPGSGRSANVGVVAMFAPGEGSLGVPIEAWKSSRSKKGQRKTKGRRTKK